MNPIDVLYWLGLAGAAIAVIVYFLQVAMFRKTVRLVTGAGLFFTSAGLAAAAFAMHAAGEDMSRAFPGAEAVVALLVAVYFQAVAALRQRQSPSDADQANEAA
jgi:hypothetical protein